MSCTKTALFCEFLTDTDDLYQIEAKPLGYLIWIYTIAVIRLEIPFHLILRLTIIDNARGTILIGN